VKQSCPEQQPAVIAADFTALYDRCLASGLKALLIFSHATGQQVLTVTCNLPAPTVNLAAAGKRRHRRRQRRARAAKASARVSTPSTATPAAPTPAAPSPALGPCPLSPETAPPPAKRTRKKRKEREKCETKSSFCGTGTRVASSSSPLYLAAARRHLPRHSLLFSALSLCRHPTLCRRHHVIHRQAIRQPTNQSLHYWNCQRHLCYRTHSQSHSRHLCRHCLRTWRHP
jgi:hypothetical protein